MALQEALDPSKRPRTETNDTIHTIRELLSQQHEQLEKTICEQLTSHKEEINREIGDVRTRMDSIEQRVTQLESPAPAQPPQLHEHGTASPIAPIRDPCQVVMGGWPDSTKRSDLISAAKQVLEEAQAWEAVEEVVVTGKRRSFVLLKLKPEYRPREKIWKIVKAVQGLGLVLPQGKKLWAGPTKTPQERKRATLASITSKLIMALSPGLDRMNADELDVEYSSGTVWLRGHKVSSTFGARPSDSPTVASGWIDVKLIAKILRLDLVTVQGELDGHIN